MPLQPPGSLIPGFVASSHLFVFSPRMPRIGLKVGDHPRWRADTDLPFFPRDHGRTGRDIDPPEAGWKPFFIGTFRLLQ